MDKIRTKFDSLPSQVKIIIYSGGSVLIGKLISDLSTGVTIDWRQYLIIPLTVGANLVAYQLLKLKDE